MPGSQVLSKEAVTIIAQTIQKSVAIKDLGPALEIGYRGLGEIACTEAAKAGISSKERISTISLYTAWYS